MLLRMDGQDHYNTAYLAAKYTTVNSANVAWTVTSDGPNGKQCLTRVSTTTSGFSGYVAMAPLVTQTGAWTPTTSGVCGFKLYVEDLGLLQPPTGEAGDSENSLISIWSSGARALCAIQLNPTGTFTAIRPGFEGTVLGISTEGVQNGVWHSVELKWVVSHTLGVLEMWVDRVRVLNVTNADTWGVPNVLDQWNAVRWMRCDQRSGSAGALTMRFCDVWLADLTGGAQAIKDFLHSWNIVVIRPNGVGSSSGWTPLAGANWTNVNETPPTGETSYVSTTAAGTRDMYAMEDIAGGATVLGFQTVGLSRLETAGGAGWTPSVRPGTTNYDATEQGLASTTYSAFAMQPYDTNPATGTKATASEINAAEFGQVKSA
jgi:hypothetical protein